MVTPRRVPSRTAGRELCRTDWPGRRRRRAPCAVPARSTLVDQVVDRREQAEQRSSARVLRNCHHQAVGQRAAAAEMVPDASHTLRSGGPARSSRTPLLRQRGQQVRHRRLPCRDLLLLQQTSTACRRRPRPARASGVEIAINCRTARPARSSERVGHGLPAGTSEEGPTAPNGGPALPPGNCRRLDLPSLHER